MKVNFDNLRRNIANSYNELAHLDMTEQQRRIMADLRGELAGLLACYDPDGEDINVISIELKEV